MAAGLDCIITVSKRLYMSVSFLYCYCSLHLNRYDRASRAYETDSPSTLYAVYVCVCVCIYIYTHKIRMHTNVCARTHGTQVVFRPDTNAIDLEEFQKISELSSGHEC